jgi:hypothetical protein
MRWRCAHSSANAAATRAGSGAAPCVDRNPQGSSKSFRRSRVTRGVSVVGTVGARHWVSVV